MSKVEICGVRDFLIRYRHQAGRTSEIGFLEEDRTVVSTHLYYRSLQLPEFQQPRPRPLYATLLNVSITIPSIVQHYLLLSKL